MADVERMRSVGSMSAEWMLQTFSDQYREEIGNTAYLSGNMWSERILDERWHTRPADEHGFGMLRQGNPDWQTVSRKTFDHYEPITPVDNLNDGIHPDTHHQPHVLTDRAIATGREMDCDRVIVHYQMPHIPFFANALDWSPEMSHDELMAGPAVDRNLNAAEQSYELASEGELSQARVREFYRENLQLVLAYVDILLANFDAETVAISADHGEGLGDKGIWAHPYGCPFESVKTVPWMETTASDEQTVESEFDQLDRNPTEDERREFLEQMGYI